MKRKSIFNNTVTFVWIILNALIVFFSNRHLFAANGIDGTVLLIGNLILYIVTLTAMALTLKSFDNKNPQVFVRAVYGGFIIKFFVLATAAFIYIMVARKTVNRPALLICAALYILYTGLEIRELFKVLKKKENA